MSSEARSIYEVKRLREGVKPWSLSHYADLASTNDRAGQQVTAEDLQPPAIIVADRQSAGRGRGKNTWWSAAGNVTATFVIPQNATMPCGLVPLLAGLAVRRALVRWTGLEDILLKWPNDLVVDERKLAGLLCERLPRVDLIGVGVNVNVGSTQAPAGLRDRITSLNELTGHTWDLTEVLISISHEMMQVLSPESSQDVRDLLGEYELHHWPTGREITIIDADREDRLTGRCQGIDVHGRLILKTIDGTHACLTGTIASIGPRIAARL